VADGAGTTERETETRGLPSGVSTRRTSRAARQRAGRGSRARATRSPDLRIVARGRSSHAVRRHSDLPDSGCQATLDRRSPFTVAGPCGNLTHLPLIAGNCRTEASIAGLSRLERMTTAETAGLALASAQPLTYPVLFVNSFPGAPLGFCVRLFHEERMSKSSTVTVRETPVAEVSTVATGGLSIHGETFVVETDQRIELVDLTERIMSYVRDCTCAKASSVCGRCTRPAASSSTSSRPPSSRTSSTFWRTWSRAMPTGATTTPTTRTATG